MKNGKYRRTTKLGFKALVLTLLTVLLVSAAAYPQTQDVRGRLIGRKDFPSRFDEPWRKGELPGVRNQLLTKDPPKRQEDVRETHKPLKDSLRREMDRPDRDRLHTIPTWSDSYTYQGLTYTYTMVGTDPKRGSATTTIPTVIVPVRFVFADGSVIDPITDVIEGRTPLQAVVNSPIFQPYAFKVGGISVGDTQYGDAFQRAEFWDSVSKRARNYHVLLGQPTVAPVFDVFVPGQPGDFDGLDSSGRRIVLMGMDVLESAALDAVRHANVSPEALPIVIWGNVYASAPSGDLGPMVGVGGLRGAYKVPGGVQTYIAAGFHPSTGTFAKFPWLENVYYGTEDTNSLTRQLVSWLNDPFKGNYTPGWNYPGFDSLVCDSEPTSDLMDVAKVSSNLFLITGDLPTLITTDYGPYHFTDAAFLDYFTRAPRSRAAGGEYTFFGLINRVFAGGNFPSSPCTGHVEIDMQELEFPDAVATQAYGINSQGWVVGGFWDASNQLHGFLYDGRTFRQIDYPGALATRAYKLNDHGELVGVFWDTAGPHGFYYSRGQFVHLNFPGSVDNMSYAFGINNRGDIVGIYDVTVAITHGFLLRNGQYRTLDTPFGVQSEARGINDQGEVVGDAYDDPFDYVTGFSLDKNGFTRLAFPDAFWTFPFAVNNLGMQGGIFAGTSSFPGVSFLTGYVTIEGYPHSVHADVYGMNDKRQIVGDTRDPDTGRVVAYVATLPK